MDFTENDNIELRVGIIYGVSVFGVMIVYATDFLSRRGPKDGTLLLLTLFFGIVGSIFGGIGFTELLSIKTINRMKDILAIMLLLDISCLIVSYRNLEMGFLLANTILLLMFMPLNNRLISFSIYCHQDF